MAVVLVAVVGLIDDRIVADVLRDVTPIMPAALPSGPITTTRGCSPSPLDAISGFSSLMASPYAVSTIFPTWSPLSISACAAAAFTARPSKSSADARR